MAKQGNYITAPTSNANWAAGFADSLSDLSDNYRDQATAKKDSELAAEALAYSRGRDATADSQYQDRVALAVKHYDTAQGRLDLTAKGVADKEALKASQIDWITKNLGGFSNAAAQQQKAESLGSNAALEAKHGLDPNLLRHRDQYGYESDRDRLLGSTPLYQEEVRNSLAKKYLAEYGTAIDPNALATVGTDLTSSVAQQATENASAEAANAREAANKESIRANFNAAKTTMEFKNNATAGKGTSKGAPNAYSNILVADLLGGKYTEGSWFLPFDDELNQAADLTQSLLKQAQKAGIPANEAIIGVKKALDLLTTGGDLQSIENDPGKAFRLVNESIAEYRSAVKSNKTDNEQFKLLEQEFYKNAAKSQYYTPKNMKVEAQKPFQKIMDELQGKTPAATTDSASAVTAAEKPKVGAAKAASDAALTALITGNLTNGVSGTVTPTTPGAVDTSGTDDDSINKLTKSSRILSPSIGHPNAKELTPTSSVGVKKHYLNSLQQDLFRATETKNEPRIRAIMGDMDKLQNNVGNVERYNESVDLASELIESRGGNTKSDNTLLVMDTDKHGNKKSLDSIVIDINSRDDIGRLDAVTKEEHEAAKGNPELEQQMIDDANGIISRGLLARSSGAQSLKAFENLFSNGWDSVVDMGQSYNPTRKVSKKRSIYEPEQLQNRLQSYINDNMGLPQADRSTPLGQDPSEFSRSIDQTLSTLYDGITGSNTNKAMMAPVAAATALPSLGRAGVGVLKNVASRKFAPKPKVDVPELKPLFETKLQLKPDPTAVNYNVPTSLRDPAAIARFKAKVEAATRAAAKEAARLKRLERRVAKEAAR